MYLGPGTRRREGAKPVFSGDVVGIGDQAAISVVAVVVFDVMDSRAKSSFFAAGKAQRFSSVERDFDSADVETPRADPPDIGLFRGLTPLHLMEGFDEQVADFGEGFHRLRRGATDHQVVGISAVSPVSEGPLQVAQLLLDGLIEFDCHQVGDGRR